MPESAKHAQECIEHLEKQTPELEKALEDIPKETVDKNGRVCINPEWCRVKGKVDKKDKQARHAAAVLPIDALNKGTENLAKTAKKALITTHCTALSKSPGCKG